MIDRRQVLLATGLLPLLGFIPPCGATGTGPIDISALGVAVPAWLFDEPDTADGSVEVLSMERNDQTQEIVVGFSDGRSLTLRPETSVEWLVTQNDGRPTRKSMLLKRTFSYVIDALFRSVSSRRVQGQDRTLGKQFDQLQTEEVLEAITIGAVFDLVATLSKLQIVANVSWDETGSRFVVD